MIRFQNFFPMTSCEQRDELKVIEIIEFVSNSNIRFKYYLDFVKIVAIKLLGFLRKGKSAIRVPTLSRLGF